MTIFSTIGMTDEQSITDAGEQKKAALWGVER